MGSSTYILSELDPLTDPDLAKNQIRSDPGQQYWRITTDVIGIKNFKAKNGVVWYKKRKIKETKTKLVK